jgi:hypothetical protein
MSDSNNPKCFGFFVGDPTCGQCAVQKQCKAVLLSSGFDLIESAIDGAMADLPEGTYDAAPEMTSLLDQIFNGPQGTDVQAEAKAAFKAKV